VNAARIRQAVRVIREVMETVFVSTDAKG